MAAIIRALVMVLSGVGVSELADKLFPGKVPQVINKDGGMNFWKNIAIFAALAAVGTMIAKVIIKYAGLSRSIRLAVSLAFFALGIASYLNGGDFLVYGLLLGVAPGGIGTPFAFNTTYVPERLIWNDAGNPLTNLRIETQEDGVLHDWSAAAIAAMSQQLNVGAMAANQVVMNVADGHIPNRNVQISGITSAVGAISIFGSSDNRGVNLFTTKLSNILANNETEFRNFSMLFLPNLVTLTDRIQVFFKDGHSQIFDPVELDVWSSLYQETQVRAVNNLPGYIDKVVITSALGGLAYVQSVKL